MKHGHGGKAEIKTEITEFYRALNALYNGDTTAMSAVWSHADDVTHLGSQGAILIGWEAVLHSWKEQAALKLGGNVEFQDMHIVEGENFAFIQNNEIGINYIEGKPQSMNIRATNIFRKENGKWKMISHHTDRPSYL